MAQGLEETAALDLAKPPGGALISMLGDIGGLRHTDLSTAPASFLTTPTHGSGTSVDYAELDPSWLVRVGNTDAAGVAHIGYSNDGGASWFAGTDPGGVSAGGSVAISADGFGGVVWSPEGTGVQFSTSTAADDPAADDSAPYHAAADDSAAGGDGTVSYAVVGERPGGFQGEVRVTNTSSSTVDGWELAWSFPRGQQVTELWGGPWEQVGSDVTVVNETWNAVVPSGGSVTVGFLAAGPASPPPTGFTWAGSACPVS